MKTYVIFNPAAARGKAGKRWPQVEKELESLHGPFISCFTEAPGHATQLTRKALQEGAEKIIAVGGDGTVNEVVKVGLRTMNPSIPKQFSVFSCADQVAIFSSA